MTDRYLVPVPFCHSTQDSNPTCPVIGSLELLDDESNLFGVVNVVDALVVLLLLAVVVAGTAFVLQPEPQPEKSDIGTSYITLNLSTQPDYLIAAINEGETHNASGEGRLTIADICLSP